MKIFRYYWTFTILQQLNHVFSAKSEKIIIRLLMKFREFHGGNFGIWSMSSWICPAATDLRLIFRILDQLLFDIISHRISYWDFLWFFDGFLFSFQDHHSSHHGKNFRLRPHGEQPAVHGHQPGNPLHLRSSHFDLDLDPWPSHSGLRLASHVRGLRWIPCVVFLLRHSRLVQNILFTKSSA